mmetsp:Transcript_52508/g.85080  ORF Transcript_52508/g.85080 Transcript_52508/m.85080 type:complete len:293 (-) Transcript_52508:62-940(-)
MSSLCQRSGGLHIGVATIDCQVFACETMLFLQVLVVNELMARVAVWCAHQAQHCVREDCGQTPLVPSAQLEVLRGLALDDSCRPERVTRDALALVLRRRAHRAHGHPELGDVVGREALEGAEARLNWRAHADDAAEAVLGHVRQAQGGHGKAATRIDLSDQVVFVHRRVHDVLPPQCAGVVDQDVDAPKLLHGEPDTLLDVVEAAHVNLHGQSLDAKLLDLLGNAVDGARQSGLWLGSLGRDDDVAALLSECNGALLPDAPGGARDDGHFACEVGNLEFGTEGPRAGHFSKV